MDTVLNLYKRKSETPLQTMGRFVASHPEYAGVKMTYAGRLDPMAEGVLVVLSGEKNKERDVYTGMDKDYEFELVFGVETDTLDPLGLVTTQKLVTKEPSLDEVNSALRKYLGSIEQAYPAYSSKVVDGTPLFEYARRGVIGSVVMPRHVVNVSRLEATSVRKVSKDEFWKGVRDSVMAVTGDFRQKHIVEAWEGYFASSTAPQSLFVYKLSVSCGSGFYVRQLVSDLGRDLGLGAVTVSIVRTRVGEYGIADSVR
jgi:tRNA pseudouridine55 synthase